MSIQLGRAGIFKGLYQGNLSSTALLMWLMCSLYLISYFPKTQSIILSFKTEIYTKNLLWKWNVTSERWQITCEATMLSNIFFVVQRGWLVVAVK